MSMNHEIYGRNGINVYLGKDVDIDNPNLEDLVKNGYQFDTTLFGEDFIHWRKQVEYHFAQIVYMAKVDDVEVASLSINTYYNTPESIFWKTIRSKRANLSDSNLLAVYIQGIVVHPSFRNNKIASRLLGIMADFYQPSVVLGQTKTPEAVAARSNTLVNFGYRTFYGFTDVTPSVENTSTNNSIDIIKAAVDAEPFALNPNGNAVYFVDPDILPSFMPDTTNFSPEIQQGFEPVIRAQESIGRLKTAASVLVSVNNSLL